MVLITQKHLYLPPKCAQNKREQPKVKLEKKPTVKEEKPNVRELKESLLDTIKDETDRQEAEECKSRKINKLSRKNRYEYLFTHLFTGMKKMN